MRLPVANAPGLKTLMCNLQACKVKGYCNVAIVKYRPIAKLNGILNLVVSSMYGNSLHRLTKSGRHNSSVKILYRLGLYVWNPASENNVMEMQLVGKR